MLPNKQNESSQNSLSKGFQSIHNNALSSKTSGPAGGVISEDLYRKEANSSKISRHVGTVHNGYSPSHKDRIPSF